MVIYLRRASDADVARLRANPSDYQAFAFEEGDQEMDLVDFDKAWHALHFMLTGAADQTDHPLGIIGNEGESISLDADGFDGFSIVTPTQIKALDAALSVLTDDALASRYDPDAMVKHDLYLADVFADEGDEALEYVMQGVPALRRFAATCAQNGDGAIRIIA